jgi:hypothetical protein
VKVTVPVPGHRANGVQRRTNFGYDGRMTRILTAEQIAALSVEERMDLIEAIWDSFGVVEQPDERELPVPAWQREVLRERLALYDRGELELVDGDVGMARLWSGAPNR